MVKISPSGRIGQQVGVKPSAEYLRSQESRAREFALQQAQQSVKPSKSKVDYESAWKEAQKHFNKGMAGAYLQHMEREAMENPRIGAVYKYLKLLDRSSRSGTTEFDPKTGKIIMEGGKPKIFKPDISPIDRKSLLKSPEEVAKQKANIEFMKKYKEQKMEKVRQDMPTIKTGEVQPAPTIKEKYGSAVGKSGYFKGTLGFIGGEVSSLVWKGQEKAVKQYGGRYDPQMAELSGKAVEVAPYFTPYVGAGLLIGGGAEEIGTKSGRERIERQREQYAEMGLSPSLATSIAWGTPVLETGLGLFGAKADIARIKLRSDIGKATTTFAAAEVPIRKPDTSRIRVITETKIGKKVIPGISRQDISKVGKEYSVGASTGAYFPTGRIKLPTGATPGDISLTFPRTKMEKFLPLTRKPGKVIETYPVVGVSAGREIGGAKYFKAAKSGEVRLYDEAGKGVLGKTFGRAWSESGAIPFEQEIVGGFKEIPGTKFSIFRGGVPKTIRVYPQKMSYTTAGEIRGVLYKTPKKIPRKTPDVTTTGESSIADITKQSTVTLKKAAKKRAIKESVLGQVTQLSEAAKVSRLKTIKKTPTIFSSTTTQVFAPSKLITSTKPKILSSVAAASVFAPAVKSVSLSDIINDTKPKSIVDALFYQSAAEALSFRAKTLQVSSSQEGRGQGISLSTLFKKPTGKIVKYPAAIMGIVIPSKILPKKKQNKVSYIPQVRSGKKWMSVSKKTMTREAALGRAATVADNSTSRRIRIVKKNKKPETRNGMSWPMSSNKFRPYRKQKGKKIKLINSFIEKKTYAIDRQGEVRGLSAAKYAGSMGWLPTKKKKNKKFKRKSPWLI